MFSRLWEAAMRRPTKALWIGSGVFFFGTLAFQWLGVFAVGTVADSPFAKKSPGAAMSALIGWLQFSIAMQIVGWITGATLGAIAIWRWRRGLP